MPATPVDNVITHVRAKLADLDRLRVLQTLRPEERGIVAKAIAHSFAMGSVSYSIRPAELQAVFARITEEIG